MWGLRRLRLQDIRRSPRASYSAEPLASAAADPGSGRPGRRRGGSLFGNRRYITEEDAYVQAVNVSISPQVAGQVVSIAAKSNTAVKKDNSLFNLDPEPYRIALANADDRYHAACLRPAR